MTNPYRPRVQQKLAHCRLLLQRLDTDNELERQVNEALLQSAAVHLAVAARLYLRELGHYLSVRNSERIFQLSDLVDLAGEVTLVAELQEQQWLPLLFAAERDVLNPPLESVTGVQMIAMSAASETVELSPAGVEGWLAALSQLAEQQRVLFAEY